MPQSFVKNYIHLIYSTKYRERRIKPQFESQLWAYQAGIFKAWDSPAIAVGGVEDHVHALFMLSKNEKLTKVIEEVKKASSKWMKSDGPRDRAFYWQTGYAAFSVSQSNVDEVNHYIETQRSHHEKLSFQDELRAICAKHHIELDERYAWD
ncbi:Transposase IS200 like protein [Anatilimnocola aggregata]|uniref:Transposase IS200 like protein n=1 Tax=Anatilimnocola aggregata TaxID=2528021 RepID=A0A517YML8_9BACT|nr:IS200/IS605 family transposase [Anatilimnocola aggregata]QDU31451.1 Transposase IS200 like protein [Anatilimnocola aggregata]